MRSNLLAAVATAALLASSPVLAFGGGDSNVTFDDVIDDSSFGGAGGAGGSANFGGSEFGNSESNSAAGAAAGAVAGASNDTDVETSTRTSTSNRSSTSTKTQQGQGQSSIQGQAQGQAYNGATDVNTTVEGDRIDVEDNHWELALSNLVAANCAGASYTASAGAAGIGGIGWGHATVDTTCQHLNTLKVMASMYGAEALCDAGTILSFREVTLDNGIQPLRFFGKHVFNDCRVELGHTYSAAEIALIEDSVFSTIRAASVDRSSVRAGSSTLKTQTWDPGFNSRLRDRNDR